MALDSLAFYFKLRILRWLTRLLAWLDRRRHPASSLAPSSRVSIPSTLSTSPGNFDVFFYRPSGYNHESTKEAQYPIVIVLHGGGWCVGHARHDERFIATLTARGAVVAAVNYRLAPEHPYPSPPTMGLDKHRTFITGFSVGGQMAFASLFMLWKALQDEGPRIDPEVLGTRAASNPAFVALKKKPASSSKLVGDIFDRAYFWKLQEIPDKGQMYISPGLAPLDVIKMALPERIFVKLAGLDPLLAEGKAAAARLKDLGKQVGCEITEDVPHYWDHLAKTEHEKRLRQTVHEKAADEIEEVLEIKKANGRISRDSLNSLSAQRLH
ncbi:hypothetical protein BDV12DRAFT_188039 [Aspergillus spectabilis]